MEFKIRILLILLIIALIFFPLTFLNANPFLENKAYLLKWIIRNLFPSQKIYSIILSVFLTLLITIFVLCCFYLLKKKSPLIISKHYLTKLMTPSEYNRQKKINTDLSLKRLQSSREYQHYLKEKKNGKIPEITLEEEDMIKFSDED